MVTWNTDGTIVRGCSCTSSDSNVVVPKIFTEIVDGTSSTSPLSPLKNILTTLSFESGSEIKSIGKYCFASFSSLQTADLSNCLFLTSIQERTFYGSALKTVILPENGRLTILKAGSFSSTKLTSITIPSTVTEIQAYFSEYGGVFGQSTLKNINIPQNSQLTTIGYAFAQGTLIESFFIPKLVSYFNPGALSAILTLKTITIDEENSNYVSIDNVIYTADRKTLIFCPCNKQTPIVFESTMTVLSSEAFRLCQIKDPIVIPDGILEINTNAFSFSHFSSIVLPESVLRIKYASMQSISCKEITIPKNVVLISYQAFTGSMLQNIIFANDGDTLLTIEDNAFLKSKSLSSIEIGLAAKIDMNYSKAFKDSSLSRVFYRVDNFPTRPREFQIPNMKYLAKIYSQKGIKKCGDVEVVAVDEFCEIKKCSHRYQLNKHGMFFVMILGK